MKYLFSKSNDYDIKQLEINKLVFSKPNTWESGLLGSNSQFVLFI